jgi:glucokinase
VTSRAIGIDIGGTKILVAAVDAAGQIHSRKTYDTDSQRGFAVCLAELSESIRQVLADANWTADSLDGIGIGCTGPVSPANGTIHNPYTLPGWDGADIVSPLKQASRVPVRLENDADAAAAGEYYFGAGRGANPIVMVTLGTGVGGGILVDGQIHRGVNGEHPELGHVPVTPDGPECYCGSRGCWESIASGTAIGAAGKEFGFEDSRAVFAARPGDSRAAAIIDRVINACAVATWTLLHTVMPERIILGGGIGEAHFDIFSNAMREQSSRATQVPKGRVEIVKARLGQDAGVIGAAALALQPANHVKTS